jgi:glutamyl-tRNA synthetase
VRMILGPVDPASFAAKLPESSEEVFEHTAGSLKGRTIDDLEDARTFVGELRAWAKERGIKTRELLHPLRLALTGRDRGPEMARLFAVLGAEEARERIEKAREARLEV